MKSEQNTKLVTHPNIYCKLQTRANNKLRNQNICSVYVGCNHLQGFASIPEAIEDIRQGKAHPLDLLFNFLGLASMLRPYIITSKALSYECVMILCS